MPLQFDDCSDIIPFSEDDSGLGSIGHPTNDTTLEELLDSMIRKYPQLAQETSNDTDIQKPPRKSFRQSFRDVVSLLPNPIRIRKSPPQSPLASPKKRYFEVLDGDDSDEGI